MLSSIAIENWRSHKDTKLQFNKGTNLLIGIMGSGKSSILDAISFALFGTFPAMERRKLNLSDVMRLNENKATVNLTFVWNDETYYVTRVIEKKRGSAVTDAEIAKNGRVVEKGTTAVNKYVEQLLHVDYDLFVRAIYSEQNNIDYFLMLDPRRRKLEMDSLLGLDRFEEARANCTSLVNKIRNNRKELETRFTKDKLVSSQKQIDEASVQIEKIKSEIIEISAILEQTGKNVVLKEKEFSDIKLKKESHDKTAREALIFETKISTLRKEMEGKNASETDLKEKVESARRLEIERSKANETAKQLEKRISALNVSVGSIDAKLKISQKNKDEQEKLSSKLSDLLRGKTKDEIIGEYEGMQSISQSLESEVQFLKSKIVELEDSSNKLKPGTAECPVCGNELGEGRILEITKKKNEEITAIVKQIEGKTKNALELKQKISIAREIIRNIELTNSRLEIVKRDSEPGPMAEELKILTKEITTLKNEKEEIAARIELVSNEIKTIQSECKEQELLLKKMASLNESEMGLAKAKETLSTLTYEDKEYEQKRTELESARIFLERNSAKKKQSETELRSKEEIKSILENELKKMKDAETEISSLVKLEEELTIYKNALIKTQTSMRNELIASINEAMNEIWEIFYPYRDYKMLRLTANEKDYQFEVYDTEWKTLESVASGGERACAALTLRVALAMVLTPNLSWLILDEPTHNLDREAVELLSQTLQMKVPEVVDQTFVITHEESLMGSEFASIYRLSRNKENIESTKVEKI